MFQKTLLRSLGALALLLGISCDSPASGDRPAPVMAAPAPPRPPSPVTAPAPIPAPSKSAPGGPVPPAVAPPGSGGSYILSDLMQKVRDTVGPLLRGTDIPAAEARMEDYFKKIAASAPKDWEKDWAEITTEAISGAPDTRGIRPWSAACKKCHDKFRETYKKEFHAVTIPVTP